jgi:hypothetical protein
VALYLRERVHEPLRAALMELDRQRGSVTGWKGGAAAFLAGLLTGDIAPLPAAARGQELSVGALLAERDGRVERWHEGVPPPAGSKRDQHGTTTTTTNPSGSGSRSGSPRPPAANQAPLDFLAQLAPLLKNAGTHLLTGLLTNCTTVLCTHRYSMSRCMYVVMYSMYSILYILTLYSQVQHVHSNVLHTDACCHCAVGTLLASGRRPPEPMALLARLLCGEEGLPELAPVCSQSVESN